MAESEPDLEIGTVGRPHGVRGALRLRLHNPDSDLLDRRREVTAVGPEGQREHWRLLALRAEKDPALRVAQVDGIADRDAAAARTGWKLVVPRSVLPPLEEGEFWWHEMPGFTVETPSGRRVGTVREVTATNVDILEIDLPSGGELLVPVVADFVLTIDRGARRVVVPEDIEERFEE